MESHIRIKVSANFTALKQLQCSEYKVLMALAGRADSVGKCFPSCAKIADDTGLHVKTVYAALDELLTYGYIKYLRKAFVDEVSGQQMSAVYQVSPFFLEIADKFIESAILLWGTTMESKLHINQQQSYASESSTINQRQETTTTTNNPGPEEELQTAKSEKQEQPQKQQREQQAERSQRSLPNPGSAIVKKYTNPLAIVAPLPDELSERLAERLNTFKISIQLARGFVFKYGYGECEKAANYYEFCSTFQDIKSPGGFYRSILEHRLADESVSVPAAAASEYDSFLES
jgi:DNA-binding transcriptional regulator YhcF (GntR family)